MKKNLTDCIQDKDLKTIAEKVESEIPVNKEDAMLMLHTKEILDLGTIANHIRKKLHNDNTYYGVTMNLNYTNICELRCPLCAFSKDKGHDQAYTLSMEEARKRVQKASEFGIDEVHIVGGLNPELKLNYFEDLLKTIKQVNPDLFIVAFTAVEYDYFAKINNIPIETVFKRLIKAGLGAIPGGGAEIFSPETRKKLAPKKISGEQWLEVMRKAHLLGLKTNATMLYNHIESNEEIVDHLFKLRELQEQTKGFKTFVPLSFHPDNTEIKIPTRISSGINDIRIFATSRIVLYNIEHIKALWMYLGEKMAQILLFFGVDDFAATYHYEKVVHAAGAKTPDYGTEAFLINLIKNAQLKPIRTRSDYLNV